MNLEHLLKENIEESLDIKAIDRKVTARDEQTFLSITSIELTEDQVRTIIEPGEVYPDEREIMALHWHPERVPLELVEQRLCNLYPDAVETLVIPTQHNELLRFRGCYGVEVDCYSKSFKRKVQLLLHFHESKKEKTSKLEQMLEHTYKYRSTQLLDYIHTILDKKYEDRLDEAVAVTGAKENLVEFVRIYTGKVLDLIDKHSGNIPSQMLKNKLLRNFFGTLRGEYPDALIDRAQIFLKAVKKIVKRNFNYEYFYRTEELIEEARSIGAGIVVPHPEQFWPILLADYDVDGYEVWNPQSQEYTDFLIHVVERKNVLLRQDKRLLIFMGDDCHLDEKIITPQMRDSKKYSREVGLQPAWHDPDIRRAMTEAGFDRGSIIEEYRSRL